MTCNNLDQVISAFEKRAGKIGGDRAWIFKAKRDPDSELLTKLDRIVGEMPDTEEGKLIKRFTDIIPDDTKTYCREYDDQFLEAMLEILGWGWLQNKYPSCKVQFVAMPDIVVEDDAGNLRAAMECKKVRTSDEDRDYFKHHQGAARPVNTRITSSDSDENPLLRKVVSTLCKAKEQLNKVEAPDKFIFMDFSWDVSAWLQEDKIKDLIATLAAKLQERSIKLIAFKNYQADKPFVDR